MTLSTTPMARIFSRLHEGDLVTTPTSRYLALRKLKDGSMLFGKVSESGKSIRGEAFALIWHTNKNAPITNEGLDVPWWSSETRIEVDKDFNLKLANRFSHLACHDDFPYKKNFDFTEDEAELIKKMLDVNFISDADRRTVELQRLRLLGVELTPRQEKIMTAVLGAEILDGERRMEIFRNIGEKLFSIIVSEE